MADIKGADLKSANLEGASLEGANLQDADFRKANLKDAKLEGANLENAKLEGAICEGAIFDGANLKEADLLNTNLDSAKLRGANLEGADLRGANLQNFELKGVNLRGADLVAANLQNTELEDSDLTNANLERANLQGANLRGANFQDTDLTNVELRGADLQAAVLIRTNLNGAKLENANLQGADLHGAKLDNSNLLDTILRDANLKDATLSKVTGLQSGQLGGADLLNAVLPVNIEISEGLVHVSEISKHARNIYLGVIAGCVFSWLTIAMTTDIALLMNSASSPLPIIQTNVPIVGFYWAAPAILLALYVYLHMYLQRLWSGLASLPAIFPDGRTLEERAYPWLLTSLVCAHVPRLSDRRPPFSRQQVFFSIFTAWALVPLTIIWFWLRYLPVHEGVVTGIHVLLAALAITLGAAYYSRARATLQGRIGHQFEMEKGMEERGSLQVCDALYMRFC